MDSESKTENKREQKEEGELIEKYLASLSKKQYKAYEIAKDHLTMSFQIEKSNGFLSWVKKNTL
jgi:predicted transposase YbfD/YdcC